MGDAGVPERSAALPAHRRVIAQERSFPQLIPRKSSQTMPTMSSFNPQNLLPQTFPTLESSSQSNIHSIPHKPSQKFAKMNPDSNHSIQGSARRGSSNSITSEEPASLFDMGDNEAQEYTTNPTTATATAGSPSEGNAFDLKPPPPSVSHANAELLCDRLFSTDHLNSICRDHVHQARLLAFLHRYRPDHVPVLQRYLEAQKAMSAIDYANAVAEHVTSSSSSEPHHTSVAAMLDPGFEAVSRQATEQLVQDALPAFITHQLTHTVTECLVKEITGNNAPIMRDLVQGLAEVYCMTDPNLPDNPIVYASDEFYRTTQYGREYVIGRNCRFLQGPKTSPASVSRFAAALSEGREICETILNYRRDGTPFLNLCLIAPLYDNRGVVRYFLGCQIDVSNLMEDGRGLDSLSRLLQQDMNEARYGERADSVVVKGGLKPLGELAQMLGPEEMEVMTQRTRGQSNASDSVSIDGVRFNSTPTPSVRPTTTRRFVGMDDPAEQNHWPPSAFGPSGRLPGVYQNYMLVRPYPSLRITFTSPALRIPGLLQSRLLDRVGGPQHVRAGIEDALASGVGVTAKISWLTSMDFAGNHLDSSTPSPTSAHHNCNTSIEGKPRWIHCTPLLGSDSKVGVWMVVMVEREDITGTLNSQRQPQHMPGSGQMQGTGYGGLPMRTANGSVRYAATPSPSVANVPAGRLYADYLRREGRSATGSGRGSRDGSR